MRFPNRLVWTAMVVALSSAPLLAQGGGGGGGGGMSGGGGAGGGSSSSGASLASLGTTPTIQPPSTTGTSTSGSSVSASNFLGPTFANPYYQGTLQNQLSGNNNPGGFGTALFPTTGSSGTGGGMVGAAGGSASSSMGRGTGGGRGSSTSSTQTWLVSNPTPISAYYKFETKPMTPQQISTASSKLQAEIAGLLARTKSDDLPNVASIQVSVQDGVLTLRGNVSNAVEGKALLSLVRLYPGVKTIDYRDINFPGKPKSP